jgi:hypothetical protein
MADVAEPSLYNIAEGDAELGAKAARLIWQDAPEIDDISDPRTPAFARAVIDGLAASLEASPGAVKKMMKNATHGAADLNVAQFQGLIEVIQNADDLQATEVRFALREEGGRQQLLVVHNGLPVTCHHVLAMALPYLTTKTHRVDQRGRFGIGLKTLNRITRSIAIHSAPYHFSGDQLSLAGLDPEPALESFYDPSEDTLLVLDLNEGFDEIDLKNWFDEWEDAGLLFLGSVGRFRWCAIDGKTIAQKTLEFGDWEDTGFATRHAGVQGIVQRRVQSADQAWTVWKATVRVPGQLHPAHKARSDTTDISVAIPDRPEHGTLYIGFKTLVPVGLTFSLDGQFDPSTAREAVIENRWNSWLIERCADVVADIASGLLASEPARAWAMIPLELEHVGKEEDRWLRSGFDAEFGRLRGELGERSSIFIAPDTVSLASIAYESIALAGFLTSAEIVALAPESRPLPANIRDDAGRWRGVLDSLAVSTVIGTGELLVGFDKGLFFTNEPAWWVEAAQRLTSIHPHKELFGRPFWLSDDGRALTCRTPRETDRPLVFGEAPSVFSVRWKLLDRLHDAYGASEAGGAAVTWLSKHAAFTNRVHPAIELAAFAERYAAEPVEIEDADLRDLRDRFDELPDRNAEELGRNVGAALLLDGYVYKADKQQRLKVSPAAAYLSRTVDSDYPNWPTAAASLPGIQWIAPRYDDQLKTGATRTRRRRDDGTISRGPRKFLMLLGAEVTPRLEQTGGASWGSATRIKELRAAGAEQVAHDYVSPDLDRVLKHLQRASRKDAKVRSPALLRALSRNWDRVYKDKQTVPSEHVARVYTYPRAPVTATWLNELRETDWVAVGRGDRVQPAVAVIKTIETQTLYDTFAVDLQPVDICVGIAMALHLITDVRVSDLITYIANVRDGHEPLDEQHLLQIYRNIANRCPPTAAWNSPVGEVTVQQLRVRFSEGAGLIHIGAGQWRRPDQVLRGKDIFHDRQRFVPGGPAHAKLWLALGVRTPNLDDCIDFCKALASEDYDVKADAVLIDVYRWMEALITTAEPRHRRRLRAMPVVCGDLWAFERPVYFVEDFELRNELARALPQYRFWSSPCDTRDLPGLVSLLGIIKSDPALKVTGDRTRAMERGEFLRVRFGQAIDHLSDELARNDASTRERISIGWDRLKALPLFVYDDTVSVQVRDGLFVAAPIPVFLKALIGADPIELHVSEGSIGDREYGGRVIASFFPSDVRRKIGGEWALAWQKSLEHSPDSIRLASDEEHLEALQEQAGKINAAPKNKIKVTAPASRKSTAQPRTLKETVGAVAGAVVSPGIPPEPAKSRANTGLASAPPSSTKPDGAESQSAPVAYTNADLEQRGWEILERVLNTSHEESLVDFRRKHGVGADGVINWKTFVEMKATGRDPQSSIEMSNAEYERAKERGMDFILALVSGLETGQKDAIRLIFDPANRVSVRPVNGARLVGLLDAQCIIINFEDAAATGEAH